MAKLCATMFANLRNESAYDRKLDDFIHHEFGLSEVPNTLYHYTKTETLGSIATDQTIWAFCHLDMPADKNELRSLESVIDEVLVDLQRTTTGPASDVLTEFAGRHPSLRAADKIQAALRCFTSEPDSLPHWHKFTAGGQGVCVGFSTLRDEPMSEIFAGHHEQSVLRVEYDLEVWRGRLRAGFQHLLDACNGLAKSKNWVRSATIRHRTLVGMAEIAALASIASKGTEFQDEKEWRHAIVPNPDGPPVAWEVIQGRRYLPLPARASGKLLFIERVIVRSPDPQQMVGRVDQMLREAGYGSVGAPMPTISISTHPFGARDGDAAEPRLAAAE